MLANYETLDLPQALTRDQMLRIEQRILQYPQVDMPTTHDFCDGVYARTMFVPSGTALTGAIHSGENFLFIRHGDITVWTEYGMKRVQGGEMIMSKVGSKRVGLTHADTLMTTVHANPTNETDAQKLWDMFTLPSDVALSYDELNKIGGLS